jgi:sirohydrochlorin cobaltochelatase
MTRRAILLVGHGSHLNPNSSAPVFQHAAALRSQRGYDGVRVAFWKEEPSLSRALDGREAADVTVVPVFISTGYFTEQVIPREMGLAGHVSEVYGRIVRYTAPVGAHPALAHVIVQRAEEVRACAADALAVLGHGTARNSRSERNVYLQAANVAALGSFAEVATVFLDQDPNMRGVFEMAQSERAAGASACGSPPQLAPIRLWPAPSTNSSKRPGRGELAV